MRLQPVRPAIVPGNTRAGTRTPCRARRDICRSRRTRRDGRADRRASGHTRCASTSTPMRMSANTWPISCCCRWRLPAVVHSPPRPSAITAQQRGVDREVPAGRDRVAATGRATLAGDCQSVSPGGAGEHALGCSSPASATHHYWTTKVVNAVAVRVPLVAMTVSW